VDLAGARVDATIGQRDHAVVPLPLTPRELEVLQLIAGGATNQKVADTLVISEQTVKSHVKNILRKLGASNRTEAASRLGPAAVR
jgi:DNA-binding NarL/FixJ family response regulator